MYNMYIMKIKSYSITEARSQFSSLLGKITRGARIPIRNRSTIVAWLIPVDGSERLPEQAQDVLKPPTSKLDLKAFGMPPKVDCDLEGLIIRMRSEDR